MITIYSYNGYDYRLPLSINGAVCDGAHTFGALAERLELAGWLNRAPKEEKEEDASSPVRLSPDELTVGML